MSVVCLRQQPTRMPHVCCGQRDYVDTFTKSTSTSIPRNSPDSKIGCDSRLGHWFLSSFALGFV